MRPLLLAALLWPATLPAQVVAPCDGRVDVRAIVEPWEDHIRSFANGAVRVALLDMGEPAAGALHLLVLTPPYNADGGRRHCRLVGWSGGAGFASLNFPRMVPSYDPRTGLSLTIGGRVYDPDTETFRAGLLSLIIDRTTGEVTADFSPTGGE